MKKKLCSAILLTVLFSIIFTAGCSTNGTPSATTIGGLIFSIAILASTGGAGAPAAFAASLREKPKAKILLSTNFISPNVKIRITSTKGDGSAVKENDFGVGSLTPSLQNGATSSYNLVGTLPVTIDDNTFTQHKVEVIYTNILGGTDITLISGRFTLTPSSGITTPLQKIDANSTAKVVVYEAWLANAPNQSFDLFQTNLQNNATASNQITLLANTIQENLNQAAQNSSLVGTTIVDQSLKNLAGSIAFGIATTSVDTSTTTNTNTNTNTNSATNTVTNTSTGTSTGTNTNLDINPNPSSVPTLKTTTDSVTSTSIQIQKAVRDSLNTALTGIPVNTKASVHASITDQGLPGIIPVVGGNSALDVNGMANIMMEAVTGVATASYGPSGIFNSTSLATFTGSTAVITDYNPLTSLPIAKRTFTGVLIETSDNAISKITIGNSSTLTFETFDSNGNSIRQITLQPTSGFSAVTQFTQKKVAGTISLATYLGFNYISTATDSTQLSFTSPLSLNISMQGDQIGSGSITITGVNGNATQTRLYYIGNYGTMGASSSWPYVNYYPSDSVKENSRNITFTNNSLSLLMNASLTSQNLALKNFSLTIPNITTGKDSSGNEVYSFSGATGSLAAIYSGSNYKDFGYIYSLNMAFSNLTYNGVTQKLADGATAEINKVSTDNTVEKINYLYTNGKLTETSNKFSGAGSSESITTLSSGNVRIVGNEIYTDPTGTTMTINYTTVVDPTTKKANVTATTVVNSTTTILTFAYDSTSTNKISGTISMGGIQIATFFSNGGLIYVAIAATNSTQTFPIGMNL
ncbi:MAG: hypothetical protein HQM08_04935 [Candidatus Riflebacteria bacterium]|nr:hypothetical protein [Candidatus Riflebacteria bacterium]